MLNWALIHAPGGSDMAHNLYAVPGEIRAAMNIQAPAKTYASITTKVLVMVGARSPEWLRQAGKDLTSVMPDAQLERVADLDHNGPLLHPELVAQRVIDSMAGTPAA